MADGGSSRRPSGAAEKRIPLESSYAAKIVFVLLALCPNIIITTAIGLLEPRIAGDLHAGRKVLDLSPAMSNAGYAFGAVLAADLFQRFRLRRLFFACQAAFALGAVLSTFAPNIELFIAGRIMQGLATGLLLVVVAPPIVQNFPSTRMPTTAATFLIGFFGATAAGPLIGGVVAQSDAWRLLFGLLALVGLCNIGVGALTVGDQPPMNPGRRIDFFALALAAAGSVLAFYGSYELETGNPGSPVAWALAGIGLLALVGLLVLEYRSDDPFLPVKPLSTSLPVIGTVCAMVCGAVFVALLELVETVLTQGQHLTPLAAALIFWPQVIGTAVAAFAFWRLFTSKFIPLIALCGMLSLALAAALIATGSLAPATDSLRLFLIAALLGIGAGSTVAPSLFLAAFGVPSSQIGRAFALVELLRSEAAFLLGPVLLGFVLAAARGAIPTAPVRLAPLLAAVHLGGWVLFGATLLTMVALVALFKTAGLVLRAPDLHAWIEEKQQALESPAVPPPSKAFTDSARA